ncbi:Hypothetical protein LUCI_3560 [Lucifera butyrica]|uniref:histidine kinase n=1 Tax=Lucifera butyrica TaxID=1351585 RepID=A0A498RAQ5_9FIRM|nr:Hypothetical protein LUCI_3560 [Lucifera butyrica]
MVCTVVIVMSMQYLLMRDAATKTMAGLSIVRNLVVSENNEHTIHIDAGDPDLVQALAGGVMLQITAANGRIVSRSPALGNSFLPAYTGSPIQTYWGHEPVLTAGFRLPDNGRVQTIYPLAGTFLVLRTLVLLFAIISGGGLILTLGLCWFGTRKMMRPLAVLTETTQRITASDLNQRLELRSSYKEMAALTATFNEMLERLEISFRNQQEFVAFASHDLRTPLTIIKNYTHILSNWGLSDPAVCREALESIQKTIATTERWVNDLLLLLEVQGSHFIEQERFPIDTMLEEIVEEARLLAGASIITCHTEPATVAANSDYIRRALWALLDNAIKYSGPEGQVAVNARIDRELNTCRITVTDSGPGISEKERERIFQPFYRSKKQAAKQGHGLGLALVRAVLTAFNGRIYVESGPGKGSSFVAVLPLAADQVLDKKDPMGL